MNSRTIRIERVGYDPAQMLFVRRYGALNPNGNSLPIRPKYARIYDVKGLHNLKANAEIPRANAGQTLEIIFQDPTIERDIQEFRQRIEEKQAASKQH